MIFVMLAGYSTWCIFFWYSTAPVSASSSTAAWEARFSSSSAEAGSAPQSSIAAKKSVNSRRLHFIIFAAPFLLG